MPSNALPDNGLESEEPPAAGQETGWVTLSVAVRPDLKRRVIAQARRQDIRPSQLCRLLLSDSVARLEQSAA